MCKYINTSNNVSCVCHANCQSVNWNKILHVYNKDNDENALRNKRLFWSQTFFFAFMSVECLYSCLMLFTTKHQFYSFVILVMTTPSLRPRLMLTNFLKKLKKNYLVN